MHCSAIIDTSSPTGEFRKAVSKYVCLFLFEDIFRNYGSKKCCTVVYIFCAVLFQDSKVNCRNVYNICIEKFLPFSSFLNCLTMNPMYRLLKIFDIKTTAKVIVFALTILLVFDHKNMGL